MPQSAQEERTLTAKDLTFGLELETHVPRELVQNYSRNLQGRASYAVPLPILMGGYHRGKQVPCLKRGWKGESDSSLRTEKAGRACVEFVSPKLKGLSGLRNVCTTIETLKRYGAEVNQTCGVHVHVGFTAGINSPEMAKLQTLVSHFEKAIFASTGTKSRETGRWAKGIQQFGSAEAASEGCGDRYRILNLRNIASGRRNAVEFRAFAGSLNAEKITGYIRICLGLVERSLTDKRTTDWEMRGKQLQRKSGEGASSLSKLWYALGWTKGRVPVTYGDIEGTGVPSIKDSKRVLMRMARKYDKIAPASE